MTTRELFETMDYGPSPEGATEALAWLDGHGNRFGHFIDGTFTAPGETFEVKNPATGAVLAKVSQGSAADIERAIKAARRAQTKWAGLGGHGRIALHTRGLQALLVAGPQIVLL